MIFRLLGSLFVLILLAPQSLAVPITPDNIEYVESRITNTTDSYIINWSEDGQEYTVTDGGYYGVRRVLNNTFWLKEIDPHIAQIIRILEVDENEQFITVGLTIIENPNDPNPTPDVPLRACVNGSTIRNGNRFREATDWCDGENEYFIGRVPFNNEFVIRFESHPTYEWWLGEGQGGIGNGIQTCEGIQAGLTTNVTNGTIIVHVKETGNAGFIGSTSVGCSVSNINFQFKDSTTSNIWRTIPTTNDSRSMDCKGVACSFSISSFGNYVRNTRCDVPINTSLRVRVTGTVLGNPVNVNSPIKSLECLPVPKPPAAVGVGIFIILAILFGFIGVRRRRRKKYYGKKD